MISYSAEAGDPYYVQDGMSVEDMMEVEQLSSCKSVRRSGELKYKSAFSLKPMFPSPHSSSLPFTVYTIHQTQLFFLQ